ncbi:hypothetical protein CDEST_11422 [Colletotrichum destructivum]|uniref:Uncharacterized protein n=1 Tax=Colletotrichum destructivum TaxID=34406 RepID=A0AAX4ITE0_9PEZI|nr:hypothetical protein CDEST_11422 [Colletotrichum destructivum]
MKFAAVPVLALYISLVSAQDEPQRHLGQGAECKKNRDCCPCDTGSKDSLYCNPDKHSKTGYRCTKKDPKHSWCANNRGQCGDWDHLN